jgi:hypothetical protein
VVNRIRVTSTSIISIGYDPDTKTLELEFVNGNTYQYFDLPRSIYEALLAADSKGAFVNTQVKDHYRYRQI